MKPYNTRSRIVLDICLQVIFYTVLLGVFWILFNTIP